MPDATAAPDLGTVQDHGVPSDWSFRRTGSRGTERKPQR